MIAGLLLYRGWRRRQTADLLLSGLLFFLACSLIEHFIGFMGVYDYAREHGHDLTFFPFDNPFAFGPLLLLYTRALTDVDDRWQRRDAWHFALPVFYYAVHFTIWSMPDAAKFHFLDETTAGTLVQYGLEVVFYLTTAGYLWLAFQRYNRYRQLIEQEYANIGRMTLDWLRLFLLAFATYLALNFLFQVIDLVYPLWYTGWYWLNLMRAILLYYISATGWAFAQKTTVHFNLLADRVQELPAAVSAAKMVMPPPALEKYSAQLTQFMETSQPWLDPELTLSDLAEKVGLTAAQLSYVVNNGFQQNFNDYINTYRVEEVKRKLTLPDFQHLSLLGIAFESGFNSKATFNRAFKKLTGNAPSQYK